MRRADLVRKVLLALGIVILAPLLLLIAFLVVLESDGAERWVEERVSRRIEREVQVDGINVLFGWPMGVGFDRIRIGNPKWAKRPHLVNAENLEARIELLPLFHRKIVMPYLGASTASAGLEREGTRATWRFGGRGEGEGESPFQVVRVFLQDGVIAYRDKDEKTDLELKVAGTLAENGEVKIEAQGRFRGEPSRGTAAIARLEPTLDAPIPLSGKARIGKTDVSAAGEFAPDLSSASLEFRLAGESLQGLRKLFGMELPDTPPYKLAGHLKKAGAKWTFDPFEGRVGDSDLRGSVTYHKDRKRPLFEADLKSRLLDFDDLGPLIGAPPGTGPGETAAPKDRARAQQVAASRKILPDVKFSTERWNRMDADVKLVAARVQRPKQLPIDSLFAHLVLQDSVMTLKPLNFGFSGGRITSNVVIDGRGKPARTEVVGDIQGLKFARMFPNLREMDEALGTLFGRMKVVGRGQSVAEILGSSHGDLTVAAQGGRVSRLLTELLEIDVARAAMLLGTRKQQVELRCAVGTFKVKNGVAEPDSFIVDTTETNVKVEGTIDFRNERIALVTRGRGKKPSAFTLRSPIVAEGPLRGPSVHPEAGPLVAQAGAAAALAAAAPPLAIVPFLEPGRGKDADCEELLAKARAKGVTDKHE